MSKKWFMILMLVTLLLASACDLLDDDTVLESIEGSGTIIAEQRDVTEFSRIEIYLGANLALTQGEVESLRIEADNNLMSYIETRVQNGRLIVSKPDNVNISPSQMIQLYVNFETLTEIEIYGSSAITGDNLELDALAISFAGSGSTHLTGTVDDQSISIQGQATINNFDLSSQHVVINISGNGTIQVNAEGSLDVSVAGMGNVHYTGNPTVSQSVSGVANIVHEQ